MEKKLRTNIILYVFSVLATALLLLALFVNTPLQNYLPGYLDSNKRALAMHNSIRIDSLVQENNMRAAYLENLIAILRDQPAGDALRSYDSTIVEFNDTLINATAREQEFRSHYEAQERFGLDVMHDVSQNKPISFISPVRGEVRYPSDASQVTNGIRIVANREVPVLSPIEGTVVSVSLIVGQGYQVVLQHSSDYITIFNHLSSAIVEPGRILKQGSVVGHIGSEPNLDDRWIEMQVWHRGKAIDPAELLSFE